MIGIKQRHTNRHQIFLRRYFLWFYISVFVFFMLSTISSYARSTSISLQKELQNLKTMQAQFSQQLFDQQGGLIQQSQGAVWLSRPGKFKWQIKQPNPQILLADGKNLWIYDVGLEQVTIKPLAQSIQDTPAALLSDNKFLLSSQFRVKNLQQTQALRVYKLIPLADQNTSFNHIILRFKQGKLSSMEMQDKLGQETRISFTKVKRNIPLNPNIFIFKIPRGVDVIGKAIH